MSRLKVNVSGTLKRSKVKCLTFDFEIELGFDFEINLYFFPFSICIIIKQVADTLPFEYNSAASNWLLSISGCLVKSLQEKISFSGLKNLFHVVRV